VKTEVVGITGLTTYGQSDTSEHGHPHRCYDFTPNPIHAVQVCQQKGADDGPGIHSAFQFFDDLAGENSADRIGKAYHRFKRNRDDETIWAGHQHQ